MAPEPRREFAVPIPVEVRRPDGTSEVEYAVNLSPGGMCLHAKAPLSAGAEIQVSFRLPPTGIYVESGAQVVWCTSQGLARGEGHHEIGILLRDVSESLRGQLEAWACQPANRRR